MKRIVCEMCGGTDLVKQEGLFVCQSCGCKYTVEEARKMMVEIDGPVEVTGTVKVDNTVSAENYLRMADNALAAGNNKEAEDYANKVVEIDAANWKAWLIKGKAAGWQSTIQNIRFSESAHAFGKALACAPEEEKAVLLDQTRDEIKKLSTALIRLRASRFEKWPDDEETDGFGNDLSAIFDATIRFIDQTGSAIKLEELMQPAAMIITDAVRSAWDKLIKPEYENDSDGHPDDHALEKMLDRAGNCLTIMRKIDSIYDGGDKQSIERYDLMIQIQRFCIGAKSYEKKTWTDYRVTLNGTEYFTNSQYVESKSLQAGAKKLRQEEISELQEKRARIIASQRENETDEEKQQRAQNEASLAEKRIRAEKVQKRIAVGTVHTAVLKEDGSVMTTEYFGDKRTCYRQVNARNWKDLSAIEAGHTITAGLKSDGTVVVDGQIEVYVKYNTNGWGEVSKWRDIVSISIGGDKLLGLKKDGTVVAAGISASSQDWASNEVSAWRDIVAISASNAHAVGLRANGTVAVAGSNYFGQLDVGSWTDIVAVSTGTVHTVGLKADGTVISTEFTGNPDIYHGQCEVSEWRDIVQIAAGEWHTLGLKADGTVVATEFIGSNYSGQCEVGELRDVIAIKSYNQYSAAVKADGTVAAFGANHHGQCSVSGLKLFDSFEELCRMEEQKENRAEAERQAAAEKAEVERKAKIEALTKEKTQLASELPNIKGMFAGSKKAKIEARLAEIEAELKKLG